ncbi:hypothetical protein FA95DRAFT_1566251 [Auriscalpium vulgare]|uniref:Uncharacterized protein n=1 Tax=Auriscalpium vulgare TaxID=40419 RepID=A0ACB8R9E9_9AGAM|nr:hypothetical protein FA95DRAFT_1566251 [Auriscalpium vulgare]
MTAVLSRVNKRRTLFQSMPITRETHAMYALNFITVSAMALLIVVQTATAVPVENDVAVESTDTHGPAVWLKRSVEEHPAAENPDAHGPAVWL